MAKGTGMARMERPRQVVFNLLKSTWGIEHRETLDLLGTDYVASRYDDSRKTARCREIVNIEPERYVPGTFRPFGETAPTLVSLMHAARRGPKTNGEIVGYFSGEAAGAMRAALDRYGLDGVLFSNTVSDIANDARLSDTDKAHLLVLLFCAAGCTGDVPAAVDETLAANTVMGARFTTYQADEGAQLAGLDEPTEFALLRVDPGGRGGRHVLSTGPGGTVIGRQATEVGSIADVDMQVSKRHARVWRDDDGAWWVQGLGSTNGTVLIDGATRETVVVEPPAAERAGAEPAPVPLRLGDTLVLAGTTQFWVQGA